MSFIIRKEKTMIKRIISAALCCAMLVPFASISPVTADAYGIDIMNFDYDDNVGFEALGSANVALSEDGGHSGGRSILVSGRRSESDGAKISVESKGEPASYTVTVWVKSKSACKLTATLGGQKANSANVSPDTWTKISGKVNIEGTDPELELEIYGLSGTNDFYIDDVSVLADGQQITTPYMPEGMNMLENSDFESGELSPFEERGCTNTVTESAAHNGKYGVSVTGREAGWTGIQVDIKDLIVSECNYEVKAWVRLDDTTVDSASFYTQLEIAEQGYDVRYPAVTQFTAKSGEWTEVRGVFSTKDFAYPVNSVKLYIGSADDNTCDFSIDDISLSYTTDEVTGSSSRPVDADPWVNTELTPLKDVYKDYFLIGAARSSDVGEASQVEDDMIKYHFDIVTAGNAMKPDALENVKGRFTWDTADYIVNKSIENGVKVHGHVLCWHEQSPDWLNYEGITREEALENLRTYIFDVMEHYKGQCYSWDVVNEAIDGITDTSTVSGILRDTPWRRAIGDDWIEYAFQYAAETDPSAKLYYNDFNLDDATKADAVVTLVKSLQEKGIRIDGIGMQGHYNTTTSIKAVENSIKKFAELGVEISVTELDVGHYSMTGTEMTEEEEIVQAQKYAQLFQLYRKYSDVIDRVTLWGIDDATSWRAENCPLIFDKDYQPKEAYYALLDPDKYLEEHPLTAKTTTQGVAIKGTPAIDGTAEALWDQVPEYNINKYVMAWQGATATMKCMWDENNLYVLMNVKDSLLSTAAGEAHMQDSVEVFVDENNGKTTYYEDDDAQYRVNCENVQSFGTGAVEDGFNTVVTKTTGGYLVEMAVPFKTPRTGTGIIGFDAQVNDDSNGDGNRTSVTKFNDMTDLSWDNTENWGEIFLTINGERDDILVNLNGRTLSFDVPPMIINDRTMVPFRKILEELGATVEYQEDGQYITATQGDTVIRMQVNSPAATVNGEEVALDSPPVIIEGRTLVPVRFISESLSAVVDWNAETRVVSILP